MRLRALVPLASLLLLPGCFSPELEGSLRELLDLHYQSVQINGSPNELAIRYVAPQGSGEDLVLEVAANLDGLTLTDGMTVDLSELAPDGEQRGRLTRNVLNDPRRDFPALQFGQLVLKSVPKSGQTLSGSFSATFAEGTDFAAGRTVFGDFSGKVP